MPKKKTKTDARRRNVRRKPASHVLTESIKRLAPESAHFTQLCDFERKIDALVERKRAEVVVAQPATATRRTVRLFISHVATPHPTETHPDAMKWSLRIEGRLLEECNRRDRDRKRLATFVNKIVIEFDPSTFPDKDNVIEWERSPASVDCDGFEITRISPLPVQATVLLFFDHHPARFKLNAAFARVLHLRSAPELDVNKHLWTYIREHNLQDERDRHVIRCDQPLQSAFGVGTFKVSEMASLVRTCLLPMDPLRFAHTIQLEQNPNNHGEDVYDVEADVDTSASSSSTTLLSPEAQAQLEELDTTINTYLAAISEAKDKREFMLSFADDPQRFILSWVMSQLQDEKEASTIATIRQATRASETFHQPWVPDAVLQYLSGELEKRRQATMQAPPSAPKLPQQQPQQQQQQQHQQQQQPHHHTGSLHQGTRSSTQRS
ncbi:hypothetical protein PTSG_01126 [Salpingoeca rosetta]|uniref:DM2 domain-containing protein n=1 Tax=Salpingoeca rosetta (strain ATCC 50818 / BSB-021) TaxID=946362 RepID=F2U0W1_SALR5|nr:uncharacterized protein PTSG_01126 [Salpingoeca rosetta]EGD80535.1 hypothetical protein PTSG_01126 [Salpingoeca rosetta]|eukprot:XP_004997096.1 hypothetical protein PTSG_01126 [Salpingoeca rosetta]